MKTVQTLDQAAQGRWITAVLLERRVCLSCLAAKVGVTEREAAHTLDWIASIVRFHAEARGHCRLCDGVVGPVYWMPIPRDDWG